TPATTTLHPSPTRRSSDLTTSQQTLDRGPLGPWILVSTGDHHTEVASTSLRDHGRRDRREERVAEVTEQQSEVRRTLSRPHPPRSEEHTSELQSLAYLVCR